MDYQFDTVYFARIVKATIGDIPLRTVADETKVSASTLSRIVRGFKPDIETFGRLCGHFRLEPREFFYDADFEPEFAEMMARRLVGQSDAR